MQPTDPQRRAKAAADTFNRLPRQAQEELGSALARVALQLVSVDILPLLEAAQAVGNETGNQAGWNVAVKINAAHGDAEAVVRKIRTPGYGH